jgi:hypothetical protein
VSFPAKLQAGNRTQALETLSWQVNLLFTRKTCKSIAQSQRAEQGGHRPGRCDEQEPQALEKCRSLAFKAVPDALADRGYDILAMTKTATYLNNVKAHGCR